MNDEVFFKSFELLDPAKVTTKELSIINDLKEYVQSGTDNILFLSTLIELANNRILELAPAPADPTIIMF